MAQRSVHAIVIGASMGGLPAARAVAEHYDQVTIIERDELPEDGLSFPPLARASLS
jgi:pyruvate/2-oxoglutarate dehydrogenase complex dihydrolipoamide dehydrogenase (E3) component